MTCLQYVYFRVRHVFSIALRFAGIKRQIVFSPMHEKFRLSFLHPRLPFRVGVDVRSIVVEQVALGSAPGLDYSETRTRRSRDRDYRVPHSDRPRRGVFWWQPLKADSFADLLHALNDPPECTPS